MVLGEEDAEGDAPSSRDALKEEIRYHRLEGKWIDGCGVADVACHWIISSGSEHGATSTISMYLHLGITSTTFRIPHDSGLPFQSLCTVHVL